MTSVTCRESQQQFYEIFGARDYDTFKSNEDKYLKLKIAFNLFGLPTQSQPDTDLSSDEITVSQCYDKAQNKTIDRIFKTIRLYRNYDEDEIYIASLFNCCQLKRSEKRKSPTKSVHSPGRNSVDTKTETIVFPIMRVKKCFGQTNRRNHCCVFVDEYARVYKNWDDYLTNNKIPKANMTFPKNGKYEGNGENQVLLEERQSPSCSIGEGIVKTIDNTSTAVSLITSGIGIASLIPAITIAPIFLTGALVTGAGAAIYSTIRSSSTLHDRATHGQSVSLLNSEARNCYFNIAAGTAGVLTTGATKAASIAIGRGINISENTAKIILSVNAFNMTVAGVNAVNSLHSVVSDIKNNKNPSTLDVIHLASTALFLGNAVISFKTANAIYKQTNNMSYSEMVQSSRQEMWVKAKNYFLKSDVTTVENNYSVSKIEDVGDICLKTLNSIPMKTYDTSNNIMSQLENMSEFLQFGIILYKNRDNIYYIFKIILQKFETYIQDKILILLKWLLDDVVRDTFGRISTLFPNLEKVEVYLKVLRNYLQFKATEMEIEYQRKKADAMKELEVSDEVYDKKLSGFSSNTDRFAYYFKLCVIKMFCANGRPDKMLLKELIKFFWDWLLNQVANHENRINERKSTISFQPKIPCFTCGGYYFYE